MKQLRLLLARARTSIIFVHELGHFAVAKAFGMRVLTFSLGFGKQLWGFRRGETEYRVAILPLGGYVKLSGEDERRGRPTIRATSCNAALAARSWSTSPGRR